MFASNGIRDLTDFSNASLLGVFFVQSQRQSNHFPSFSYIPGVDRCERTQTFSEKAFRGSRYLEDFGRLALGILAHRN